MEDFLKFLLIAGVILVGIFKEVNKNSKSKKAKNNRPVPPTPSPVDVAPDATPMPEAAQDERNSRQGAHYNTSHDSHDNKEDFTIHSAEEARRAIIWGEILQRKY